MQIQLPDGNLAEFPDDMPHDQIEKVLQAHYAQQETPKSPLDGMNGLQRFTVGAGKAFHDLGIGGLQVVNSIAGNSDLNKPLVKEMDAEKIRDTPLLKDRAGFWGNVSGNVAAAIPTAFAGTGAIPALATGAGLGALQPTGTDDSRLENTALGAAFGLGGNVIPRLAGTAVKGGMAYFSPLLQSGQDSIVAKTLSRFASDPESITNALTDSKVPGYKPTLAEATQDPGIAGLQLAVKNADPTAKGILLEQEIKNNSAHINALQGIAQDDTAVAAAKQARNAATKPLYDKANNSVVNFDSEINDLLSKPSIAKAFPRAERLSQETGIPLFVDSADPFKPHDAQYTGGGLHLLKMAMDDMLQDPASGIAGKEANAVRSTRDSLVSWMGKKIPEYDQARQLSADMAKPVNQMEVGQALLNKLQPALFEGSEKPTNLTAGQFAKSLRDSDQLVKKSTGFNGATLENTMTPEQIQLLNGIKETLGRKASADNMAKTVGSTTAQNLVAQNLLHELGVPESLANGKFLPNMSRLLLSPHKLMNTESQVTSRLAEVLRNPEEAKRLVSNLPPEKLQTLAQVLSRPSTALAAGFGADTNR